MKDRKELPLSTLLFLEAFLKEPSNCPSLIYTAQERTGT